MARDLRSIAWLAGLLEGEGSFARGPHARINLAMTDVDVVRRAADLMGGAEVYAIPVPGQKTRYQFGVYGPTAAGWMMTLWPFMGARRRERISEQLLKWRATPAHPRDRKHCPQGHPYSPENTYEHTQADGTQRRRRCKLCVQENNRRQRLKRKASAS